MCISFGECEEEVRGTIESSFHIRLHSISIHEEIRKKEKGRKGPDDYINWKGCQSGRLKMTQIAARNKLTESPHWGKLTKEVCQKKVLPFK